jgi:hypothetical protein
MEINEKEKLRSYYFKLLKRTLGWDVAFDANKKLTSTILDISLFLRRTKDGKQEYGFLQVPYNDKVSYERFEEIKRNENGSFKEFVDRLDSMIYPYDFDDVVAQLLHLGYHIQDVYTIDNTGKLNLKLDGKICKELIEEFTRKSSPLLNMREVRRPKSVKNRQPLTKTFYNVEVFGKK